MKTEIQKVKKFVALLFESVVTEFLGFTRTFFSNSEWGSTQNVLMIVLHWEQANVTKLHTFAAKHKVNTYRENFFSVSMYHFGVDPQLNL